MIYFLSKRGEKSILEKKKHKLIGEINMLNQILLNVEDAEQRKARQQTLKKEKV